MPRLVWQAVEKFLHVSLSNWHVCTLACDCASLRWRTSGTDIIYHLISTASNVANVFAVPQQLVFRSLDGVNERWNDCATRPIARPFSRS